MATSTTNYNLRKPSGADFVEVTTDINANMDTIDNEIKALDGRIDTLEANAWADYTPTWSSSGTAPALGNGTLVARYRQTGKLVFVQFKLTTGSTTTYGTGTYRISLPVAAAATCVSMGLGGFRYFDNSGSANYGGNAYFLDVNTVQMLHATGSVSATTPFTWADGDIMTGSFFYEAA